MSLVLNQARGGWRNERLAPLCGRALVLLGAILVRSPVLTATFPLVDGGLFYSMVAGIQKARFGLPLTTSYNLADLPFAYPPLALYLAALLDRLGPWTAIDLLRWLPLALNLLAIPAVYRLARLLLGFGRNANLALLAFVLLPESYRWFIMGGGLTRSAGFLFAVLTLCELALLCRSQNSRHLVLAGLCGGLTLLSHPQMAWFALISAAVFLLFLGRTRAAFFRSAAAAGIALIVSAPWWLMVLMRHGPGVLLSAANHGWPAYSGVLRLLTTGGAAEPLLPVLLGSAMLGAVACPRFRWIAAWVLALFALDSWLPEIGASIPIALLAGLGLGTGLELVGGAVPAPKMIRCVRGAVLLYALFAGLLFAANALPSLSLGERAAMAWVSRNTAGNSRFLVISGDRWGDDRSAEWFPALAGRTSVNTVQGYEWAGGSEFARRVAASQELRRCVAEDSTCLDAWLARWGQTASYVYVAKRGAMDSTRLWATDPAAREDCCRVLRDALARDGRYTLRFVNTDAAVFERRPS